MSDITPTRGHPNKAPHPGLCPVCGLAADNAITRRSDQAAIATFVCTEGHLFSVAWVEAD